VNKHFCAFFVVFIILKKQVGEKFLSLDKEYRYNYKEYDRKCSMKRGFTLVEMILSIGLIVIIGAASIVSLNFIKKSNKTKTLEKMSDEILTAVNLYVETNSDVKEKLYGNKNGLKIPLTTLENSGLVDFGDLSDDLDEEDFVVTMLGTADPDDDHCASTYTAKSWNITSGETIYICEKADGTQNLVQVAGNADNLSKVTREPYFFNGEMRHLIKYNDKVYKILMIDTDDSLVIYNPDGDFSGIFTENQILPVDVIGLSSDTLNPACPGSVEYNLKGGFFSISPYENSNDDIKGTRVTFRDANEIGGRLTYHNDGTGAFVARYFGAGIFSFSYSDSRDRSTQNCGGYSYYVIQSTITINGYKIRLKPCMQIVSGTGSVATPYILVNNCK